MLSRPLSSLILFVSLLSATSIFPKSVFRRQVDAQSCQAIEGFDCKCSYYRVTCTTERDLQTPINVLPNEKHKYQTVELVVAAPYNINVNDQTFAPVKELYKHDTDNLEFRIKFEKFTGLHLSSPGIFNHAFPDNLPANARKRLVLEIYDNNAPIDNNQYLFQNLNADSVELYALYPFKGTFQQLFEGANIKYLSLRSGDIRSDLSQPFTGSVGRLELAKQAGALSVQNFPVYPAHELIINAFYVDKFNSENPPNYNNLGELRVHSNGPIPANAFRNFPNIHTLQVSTDQNIDPQAFNGLNKLEKLVVKDAKLSLDALNNLPNLKEYETDVEKLDEKAQCQLLEKLANGQLAVQATPSGQGCTCVSAYLDTAAGRLPCDAQHCEHSSCAAIKNNYDVGSRTFKAPPAIRRADGSDAFRQREPQVYSGPFQVSSQDQDKLQQGTPQHIQQPTGEGPQGPDEDYQDPWQTNPPYSPDNVDLSQTYQHTDRPKSTQTQQYTQQTDSLSSGNRQSDQKRSTPKSNEDDYGDDYGDDDALARTTTTTTTTTKTTTTARSDATEFDLHNETDVTTSYSVVDDQQDGDGQNGIDATPTSTGRERHEHRTEAKQYSGATSSQDLGRVTSSSTVTGKPSKNKIRWLSVMIIVVSVVGLLLIGLLILFIRKNKLRNNDKTSTQALLNEKRLDQS